jgi:hypothetical protein
MRCREAQKSINAGYKKYRDLYNIMLIICLIFIDIIKELSYSDMYYK